MESLPDIVTRPRAARPIDVLLPGGANVDVIVPGDPTIPEPGRERRVGPISLHTGGGGALCALGLARLGLSPALWGVVGDDPLGRILAEDLEREGVRALLERDPEASTGISIAFNPERDRSFLTWDGSCSDFLLPRLDRGLFARSRHVHFTGYRGRSNHGDFRGAVEDAVESGCSVSIDIGWDDSGEWHEGIFEILERADLFFCNEVEAMAYTRSGSVEAALESLAGRPFASAVKLGAAGSAAVGRGLSARSPAFAARVVDTTGAGDSFDAGFLFAMLGGLPVRDCLAVGNACGALSITKAGGGTAFPRREELASFMAAAGRLPAAGLPEPRRMEVGA